MAELFTLRTTLDAHDVPFRVDGEHTHGMLGPIQGAMARSRVMVPRKALEAARALAEDIVGPFDERPPDDEVVDGSPFRKPAELAAAHEPRALVERPKSYAVLSLVGLLVVGPLFGCSHLYVGHNVRAGLLALTSVFSYIAMLRGSAWAPAVLGVVWVADLVGGAIGIAQHNRRVRQLPAPEDAEDDADADADEAEDDAKEAEA